MKKDFDPRIVVLGVGGAGCNAVDNMIINADEADKNHIEFAVCNTDAQALESSPCEIKIKLGPKTTQGLGAGSRPECGKKAAEESIDTIMEYLAGANMVIITAGMGGGTGTGASAVISEAAKAAGILTLAIVTKPFAFEGSHRNKTAENGIKELQEHVDTLVIVSNQNLHSITDSNTPFTEAFGIADKFLSDCISSVVNIIKKPGLINVDFADLSTVIKDRKNRAMMGSGSASGDNKGSKAAVSAMSNLLLDFGDFAWKNVDHVLVCITGGPNLSMDDVSEATQKINEEISSNAHIILGATFEKNMDDSMRIFVFGTSKKNEEEIRKASQQANSRIEYATSMQSNSNINIAYDNEQGFVGSPHDLNEPDSEFDATYSKGNKNKSVWGNIKQFFKTAEMKGEIEIKQDQPDFLKKNKDS